MDKKELLKFCRYYKGEKENPFEGKDQMKDLMWGYESKWVKFTMKASEDDKCQEAQILSSSLNEYIRAGMIFIIAFFKLFSFIFSVQC